MIALDQNKWVEIARAWALQDPDRTARRVIHDLVDYARDEQAVFPLTATNIYETYKVNDPGRRFHLAFVQSCVSEGNVSVGRHVRRDVEVKILLSQYFSTPLPDPVPDWFLSKRRWEAVAPASVLGDEAGLTEDLTEYVDKNPAEALFSYLADAEPGFRSSVVRSYSNGLREVLVNIQKRRRHHATDGLSIRRKALGLYMFMEN